MADIKQAIEYAKNNPESPFANELRKRIESGSVNTDLQKAGLKQYILNTNSIEKNISYIDRTISGIGDAVTEAKKQLGYGDQSAYAGQSAIRRGTGAVSNIASIPLVPVTEAIKDIPGVKKVEEFASGLFNKAVDTISSSKKLQGATQGDTSRLEDVLGTVSNVGNIADKILGAKGTQKGITSGIDTGKNLADTSIKGVKTIPLKFKSGVSNALDSISTTDPVKLEKIKSVASKDLNDYVTEFKSINKIFKDTQDKIEGYDFGKELLNRNLLPDVKSNGSVDLSKSKDFLLKENSDLANKTNEILSKSNREYSLVNLKEIIESDIKKRVSSGDVDSALSKVDTYISGLKKKTGKTDSINSQELYRLKLDADGDVNYKTSTSADINTSKVIADVARNNLKNDIKGVSDLLDQQRRNYETMRIIDGVDGNKVLAGRFSTRLAQMFGGFLGASEGTGLLQKVVNASVGAVLSQKTVQAIQQAAFIDPIARRAIVKEAERIAGKQAAQELMKKLGNAQNLSQKNTLLLRQVAEKRLKPKVNIDNK